MVFQDQNLKILNLGLSLLEKGLYFAIVLDQTPILTLEIGDLAFQLLDDFPI